MPTLTEISQQQKDSEEGVLHVEFAMAALNGFLSNPNISMQDPSGDCSRFVGAS
jgi:hypothetical protein